MTNVQPYNTSNAYGRDYTPSKKGKWVWGRHRVQVKSDKPGKAKFLHYTKGYRYEGA